jgi:hypothetical protein
MIEALPLGPSNCATAEDADLPHVLLVLDQFPKTLGGGERIVPRSQRCCRNTDIAYPS